jgi:hypothetical protein
MMMVLTQSCQKIKVSFSNFSNFLVPNDILNSIIQLHPKKITKPETSYDGNLTNGAVP